MARKKRSAMGEFTDSFEATACGWFFGISNLALLGTSKMMKLIMETVTDDEGMPKWGKVVSDLQSEAMRFAESDSDWSDMLLEIKDWIKHAGEGDEWTVGEWKKYSNKWGFRTSIQ